MHISLINPMNSKLGNRNSWGICMECILNNELYHYGVKGMKWGVRNEDETSAKKQKGLSSTQKALIAIGGTAAVGLTALGIYKYGKYSADTVIKAGESIQRIGKSATELHDEFYASDNDHDNKRYEALLPNHLENNLGATESFKKKYTVDKNIKVASDKNAKAVYKQLIKEGKIKQPYSNYDKFNQALVSRSDDAKEFYKRLQELGYGAVGDVNDRKYSGYNTKSPLIFFGDSKNNVTLSAVTKISNDETKFFKELGKAQLEGAVKNGAKISFGAGTVAYGKKWYEVWLQNQNSAKN